MKAFNLAVALHHFDAAGADTRIEEFQFFLNSHADVFQRHHPPGHFTGSAWLVNAVGTHVLLTHHRKLQRWLQLGGHADGDADLRAVALREAEEESGLTDLHVEDAIFDLDAHEIPARGADPAHIHWDVRFVVHARGSEQFAISEESLALAWVEIATLLDRTDVDASVRRMAERWQQRQPLQAPAA
jgi:8-oxo-dGTP pyrophosphatase MutT (NUDIX family)